MESEYEREYGEQCPESEMETTQRKAAARHTLEIDVLDEEDTGYLSDGQEAIDEETRGGLMSREDEEILSAALNWPSSEPKSNGLHLSHELQEQLAKDDDEDEYHQREVTEPILSEESQEAIERPYCEHSQEEQEELLNEEGKRLQDYVGGQIGMARSPLARAESYSPPIFVSDVHVHQDAEEPVGENSPLHAKGWQSIPLGSIKSPVHFGARPPSEAPPRLALALTTAHDSDDEGTGSAQNKSNTVGSCGEAETVTGLIDRTGSGDGDDHANNDSHVSDAAALSVSTSNVALGSPVGEKRPLARSPSRTKTAGENVNEGAVDGELELMYDPVLNCYYDQSTGKCKSWTLFEGDPAGKCC